MAKKRTYKRASDGRFGTVAGKKGSKSKSKKSGTKTNVRAGSSTIRKRLKKTTKGKVSQAAVRKARNQAAIDKLRKQGVKIPAGSITKMSQLKKGESVTLADGTVITRTEGNAYKVKKPKGKTGFSRTKKKKK